MSGLAAGAGVKDLQTVDPAGVPTTPAIDGVTVRPAPTHTDHRGSVVELLSEGWPEHFGDGVPHIYLATVVPGTIKGWVCHQGQDDRSVLLFGRLRWVLYDGREASATHGLIQTITQTEATRALVTVPEGVWHAVQNVGPTEAGFVNMPTAAYDYGDPDKHRLPLDTDEIPFSFQSQ